MYCSQGRDVNACSVDRYGPVSLTHIYTYTPHHTRALSVSLCDSLYMYLYVYVYVCLYLFHEYYTFIFLLMILINKS